MTIEVGNVVLLPSIYLSSSDTHYLEKKMPGVLVGLSKSQALNWIDNFRAITILNMQGLWVWRRRWCGTQRWKKIKIGWRRRGKMSDGRHRDREGSPPMASVSIISQISFSVELRGAPKIFVCFLFPRVFLYPQTVPFLHLCRHPNSRICFIVKVNTVKKVSESADWKYFYLGIVNFCKI